MVTVPIIAREAFDTLKADPGELIWTLCDRYREIATADPSQQLGELNNEQNVLLSFEAWDGQVCNGGIIQLIENGYGAFIFEGPIADYLRTWGLEQTASIIDTARPLYRAKKEILERKKTLEEFAKMYAEHTEFEPLDNEYYQVCDSERERAAAHVIAHIGQFARIQ